ncbi:MAG: hypothetical protein J2P27_18770 [Actinobacteria bacterium]|nr:hypothetical protein [Actinomycetota bacterium]
MTVVIADLTTTMFCGYSAIRRLVQARQFAAAHDAQLRPAVTHPGLAEALIGLPASL